MNTVNWVEEGTRQVHYRWQDQVQEGLTLLKYKHPLIANSGHFVAENPKLE